jgi:hypothetical protein
VTIDRAKANSWAIACRVQIESFAEDTVPGILSAREAFTRGEHHLPSIYPIAGGGISGHFVRKLISWTIGESAFRDDLNGDNAKQQAA